MDERGSGRGYYRGGRNSHRYYRGRSRGRGRGHRHQPYISNRSRHNNSHGGRGRGRPGNRFGVGSFDQQDPETALLRQVYSFVSRVGELKNIRESEPSAGSGLQLRPVEATTAKNINDLVAVLCSHDKIDMLFKYQPASTPGVKADEKIGNLGHLVICCAASLPLQTPCYAALTLAINEQIKGSQWEGFAFRCVEYAMHKVIVDMDMILGSGNDVAHAACRMKLLLRYLAILGKIGVVRCYDNDADVVFNFNNMTIFGFLCALVQTAKASQERNLPETVAHLLISLVLSTLPYLAQYVPPDVITESVHKPIGKILQNYKSTFSPGIGCTSILLKGEQDDGEDMDDDEEDDDADSSGQICDSIQDLFRASMNLHNFSRFSLPSDCSWKGLIRHVDLNEENGGTETQARPVTFTEEAIYLPVAECTSLRYLLRGEGNFTFVPFSLDGVVFGRLPIFGSPPVPDDDDDDDDDDIEEGSTKNEELNAFMNNFSHADRFFVSDVIRDCLISHETFVNHTGLQLGSPKSVAEELLSVNHLFTGGSPSKGMTYAVVETLFGLIVQSREQCVLGHTFLSRVLLELTKLRPLLISPALVVAMTNVFDDYLPALVPIARDNICRWFAFHLTNTDYQWPSAYWRLWEPYATSRITSSRGCFVRRSIYVMVENVSDPTIVMNGCLATAKSLFEECFPRLEALPLHPEGDLWGPFEEETEKRIWDLDENPNTLQDYAIRYETHNSSLVDTKGRWFKTIALMRVLVAPLKNIQKRLNGCISKRDEGGIDQMVDDTHESKDYYTIVTDAIEKYGKTFVKILNEEAKLYGDVAEGGALALRHVEAIANFNTGLLRGLVASFLRNSMFDGIAIARWALADFGEAIAVDVVPRWWEFVTDVILISNAREQNDGMIIDGIVAKASATSATSAQQTILSYTVRRVCTLLSKHNQKRLDSLQVDLLEGTKYIALRARSMYGWGDNILSSADQCFGSSDSMAVGLLKSSLLQLQAK